MTAEDLWKPDERLGSPIKVGEWLYAQSVPVSVRLFKSNIHYGSGDDDDPPEISNDRIVDCSYLELQSSDGSEWGSMVGFFSFEEVERFGREKLGDTLQWHNSCDTLTP
jgi:hypothetical protein